MIEFTKIRWKNFLSTGNSFTEIKLNDSRSTLIVGQNGAGKSTLLDAISFALFGKPHRSINKPQLVNTINNKDCIVEVEFRVGSSEFKVKRGIKPGIFEIYKNGKLFNQESHTKEYQKLLEQNILKLNHKSFHQVVVLGSSSFIPFMQLPAQHRRDVIEDLLDINIFSKMNVLLKEKISDLKDKINDTSYSLDIVKNKIDTQNKYIKDVNDLTETNINNKKKNIENDREEIEALQEQNIDLSSMVDEHYEPLHQKLASFQTKKQSLVQFSGQFKSQMSAVAKDAKFYSENETCPTCDQSIEDALRNSKMEDAKTRAKELKAAMDKASEETTIIENEISMIDSDLSVIKSKQNQIHINNQAITRLQNHIITLEEDIAGSAVADLNEAKEELSKMIQDKDDLLERKLTLSEELAYKNAMAEMLKDTGIKTKVIKQYLPVINKLVNSYLQVLDFFVHFDLDESFTETIRSRHRDAFSYDSFSEGEKQRIDLSLLFTWRQIAKMKNSVATNLLILDETFDSSLDHDGVENLIKILSTLDDNTNTFVISHKGDILENKFLSKIEFYKDKNFSKMKQEYVQS